MLRWHGSDAWVVAAVWASLYLTGSLDRNPSSALHISRRHSSLAVSHLHQLRAKTRRNLRTLPISLSDQLYISSPSSIQARELFLSLLSKSLHLAQPALFRAGPESSYHIQSQDMYKSQMHRSPSQCKSFGPVFPLTRPFGNTFRMINFAISRYPRIPSHEMVKDPN